jgi:hypothetical protein
MRLAILCGVFAVAGCGPAEPKLVPAGGTVRFTDGKPVAGGIVEFAPDGPGPAARGKIGSDGSFTLETNGKPGAVAGAYRVVVLQMVMADGAAGHVGAHHAKMVVNPKHAKFDTSGIVATIPESGDTGLSVTVTTAASAGKGW